jgi:hypothetical protein
MNKIRFWCFAMAAFLCISAARSQAQTTQAAPERPFPVVTRTIELKYVDPFQIKTTLDPVAKVNGTIITVDQRSKLLLLTGSPERISDMESLIRKLDTVPVPDKSIEITGYLLLAGEEPGSTQNIPPALESALKQLRATFNYKFYHLADTIYLRNRTGGGGNTSGNIALPALDALPGNAGIRETSYQFRYERSYLTHDEKGDVIHLSGVYLGLSRNFSISTDVDLRSGQTVIVGKTSVGMGNMGLIAVITAKIVD